MYNGKIIDSHMHLCNLSTGNYDWLTSERPEQIQILGEGYSFLAKNFLPEDYEALAKPENIVGTVHLQYEANDSIKETQWLTHQTLKTGIPNAIVAQVNLSERDAAKHLKTHLLSPYLKGIRMLLTYYEGKPALSLTDQNHFKNPVWQKNFSLLKPLNLSFDVQIYDTQADDLIATATKHPDVPIMVNHLLWPIDSSGEGFAFWQKQIKKLAACENVHMKISGAAVIFKQLSVPQLIPYVETILEYFTPKRCVVGSNYPPEGVFTGFHHIWDAYRTLLNSLSQSEQASIFYHNAKSFYRIESI
ncbi:amidohydrolase family protein [Legionella impletisoli]|uniref:Amidohydrolase-related domain-containing protein n=1 Tax=Legionella impletisoli TaxID=343510 RepID=A0A917JLJ1_9GAMM|nr:amidohydrolase family protein [Legionella impletisoli]GGI75229.1 hypothetical protein GCM10007966_00030 [Legionella impletisoli]